MGLERQGLLNRRRVSNWRVNTPPGARVQPFRCPSRSNGGHGMKTWTTALLGGAVMVALVAPAGAQEIRQDVKELRQDRRDIRNDRRDIREDRKELKNAVKSGDKEEIKDARKDLRADRKDLRSDRRDRRQDRRELKRDIKDQKQAQQTRSGEPSDEVLCRRVAGGEEAAVALQVTRHQK